MARWWTTKSRYRDIRNSSHRARVAGGPFYGPGDPPAEDPQMARQASEEKSETVPGKDRTPLSMIIPAAGLVGAALDR
jgi:hypothetical protein